MRLIRYINACCGLIMFFAGFAGLLAFPTTDEIPYYSTGDCLLILWWFGVSLLYLFNERKQVDFWVSELRRLKFWTSKPRVYPENINDIVADRYREKLFR